VSWIVVALESADALCALVEKLQAAGFADVTTYTPHDVPGLPRAIPSTNEPMTRYALAGGVAGILLAFGVQWWGQVHAYPLDVGGRPLFPIPAFIPVTFEGAILGAGLAILAGWLWRLRLPRLWHPIDELPGFDRTTIDRFWVTVPIGSDAARESLRAWLAAHGVGPVSEFSE
jgi:ActD protein